MEKEEGLPEQPGSRWHIPLFAKLGGGWDERTYYSSEVGDEGQKSLKARGRHKLYVPAIIAMFAAGLGYTVMGWKGLCFPLLFLMGNVWIQSQVNPRISEKRARHQWATIPVAFACVALLLNGTFATLVVTWALFKPEVDQWDAQRVTTVMLASQEKQNLAVAGDAYAKVRASLLERQQIDTSGIDRARKAYALAQETAASANAAYQKEITVGNNGRPRGNGDNAKALLGALQIAQAAEANAKSVLDQAEQKVSGTISVPAEVEKAYTDAKGNYEAKERSLTEAGPGLLNTFWFLLGQMHTHPLLYALVIILTGLEASGVFAQALEGYSIYERVRMNTLDRDARERREARRIQLERIRDDRDHRADVRAARRGATTTPDSDQGRDGVTDLDEARGKSRKR